MDTDSLVYHIKTKDFYADILNDVEERFDMSRYNKENAKPLPIGKNKKVIGLMKDELGDAIMTEFMALRDQSSIPIRRLMVLRRPKTRSAKDSKSVLSRKP